MWKNNRMEGYGEFLWVEGKKYFGFYKNDKKNGLGIYYWPCGKIFIGFWKNGKQHGIGKYIKKNNLIKYGKWKDGIKELWTKNEKDFEKLFEKEDVEVRKYINIFKWRVDKLYNFMGISQEEFN